MSSIVVLGAGITGLCAGYKRNRPVYESSSSSGGICGSYYLPSKEGDGKGSYRFEKGGGHWIFGKDEKLLKNLKTLTPVKEYTRQASVYFPDRNLYVPYPLQNHVYAFPKDIQAKVEEEMLEPLSEDVPVILYDWLIYNFGKTLSKLFFLPFHDLYTAGLTKQITIQDVFKSPSNRATILQGLKKSTSPVGYNTTYVYPNQGLDYLMSQIGEKCDIHYNKKAVKIDILKKIILFQDGSKANYKKLISTIPLSEIVELCGLGQFKDSDPYTSVLVLNIGAQKGPKCPSDHWVYVPASKSGFHRVGFYSNVDISFLPKTKHPQDLVSIYVEKAFLPHKKPTQVQLDKLCQKIVEELKEWGYIKNVEVLSPTWIEHAYTWQSPGSMWKEEAIDYLKDHGIDSIGRYGAWKFQGILDSMKDGYLS